MDPCRSICEGEPALQEEEVRYHMLRPAQVVARRRRCPVAYVPIGTLEWHGVHNPLGADTLQAEGLATLCARKGGGLVLPPLYYGESRLEALVEANSPDRELIAEQMELPAANFAAQRQPFTATQQAIHYHKLLVHILAELGTLGFEVGVLVAGHYPLIDHARSAVLQYNQGRVHRGGRKGAGMLAWACIDYLLVGDRYPSPGDHAGYWETSHIMALHPETVDLSALPAKGHKLIGTSAKPPPHDANAEFGAETLEAAAEIAVKEVHHRLHHKHRYLNHGRCLQEGLWKEDNG